MNEPLETTLFVYGTLLAGLERHPLLTHAGDLGPAVVTGCMLHVNPLYPGMVSRGHRPVLGHLYRVDHDTLTRIDAVEGFVPAHIGISLFIRELVNASPLDGSPPLAAQTYLYNQEFNEECIPHGDYRRYRLEREARGHHRVAIYDTHLNLQELAQRVGIGAPDGQPGVLPHWRLVFNRPLLQDPPRGLPNIQYQRSARLPAVAMRLTTEQLHQLDAHMGIEGPHCLRIGLPFETREGLQLCHTYVASPSHLNPRCQPDPQSVELLRAGYTQHGFDSSSLPCT